MDTGIHASQSFTLRPQRGNGASPASERQDGRVTRSSEGSPRAVEVHEVKEAANRLNSALQALNKDLAISVHEGSGKMVVEVTDPSTGEVIRQIPPERVLEVDERIDNIVGLFVNDTA